MVKFSESSQRIPDMDSVPGHKGVELSKTPVVMKSGDWVLNVVPWIGGRIISMEHVPSGMNPNLIISSLVGSSITI